MKKHPARLTVAATAALALATSAHAADLFWQGGTADLGSANYTEPVSTAPDQTPGASDILYIGADGTATRSSDLGIGRLIVGHNGNTTAGAPGLFPGAGTVEVTGGTLSTANGAAGSANAGVLVGLGATGTLAIDGAVVTSNRLAVVGFGNDTALTATLNLLNGATFNVSAGNLNVGDAPAASEAGIPGHVVVTSGNLNISGSGADLVIGVRAGSTFSQADGATTVADITAVGRNAASNSSFTLGGGTFNTNSVAVAESTATGVSFSVTGGTLTVNAGFTAATGDATNTSVTFSGNASVSTGGHLTIGSGAAATNSTLTIKDNATVQIGVPGGTANHNLFLGRSTASGVTFNLEGGTVTIDDRFLMGTGANPTGVVTNHSAGSLTTGQNWVLADTGGDSVYHFFGGSITAATGGIVGRQKGTGTMNHTGGSATFNNRLRVGDSDAADPLDTTLYGTGTYNISGGSLTVNVVPAVPPAETLPALAIAPAGTGTFRVIGDDAAIQINGDVLVNARTAPATGTLAFQLETSDAGLSTINATGTATFNADSILQLDFNSVEPVQGVYNALVAADILNNGLVPSIPAGWSYQIVPSAGGKTLRFIAGDFNADSVINADDLVWIDRGRAMGLTGGANGDLNGDGVIDAEDYILIDQAYAANNTLSPGFLAARASDFGDAYVSQLIAAVPEPSLAACGVVLVPLVRRRRSR